MRINSIIIFIAVALSACERSDNSLQALPELEITYEEIANEAIEQAERTHLLGHELRLKDSYFHNDKPNDQLLAMTDKLDRMHALIHTFYHFADSILIRSKGKKAYALDTLVWHYQATIDSLNSKHRINEAKLAFHDFKNSALKSSAAITVARMKRDIAENGHHAMYAFIDVTAPHAIYDDFSSPSVRKLSQQGASYSFTIHYRTGQQFPDLKVSIDTIMLKGKIIRQKAFIHHDDILWVVNFDKLQKGSYEVKGRVRAVTGKLDVKPFSHRFQIL